MQILSKSPPCQWSKPWPTRGDIVLPFLFVGARPPWSWWGRMWGQLAIAGEDRQPRKGPFAITLLSLAVEEDRSKTFLTEHRKLRYPCPLANEANCALTVQNTHLFPSGSARFPVAGPLCLAIALAQGAFMSIGKCTQGLATRPKLSMTRKRSMVLGYHSVRAGQFSWVVWLSERVARWRCTSVLKLGSGTHPNKLHYLLSRQL